MLYEVLIRTDNTLTFDFLSQLGNNVINDCENTEWLLLVSQKYFQSRGFRGGHRSRISKILSLEKIVSPGVPYTQ